MHYAHVYACTCIHEFLKGIFITAQPLPPSPVSKTCWNENSNIRLVTMLLVGFIMHEYLHKYFENIKKLEKKFHM